MQSRRLIGRQLDGEHRLFVFERARKHFERRDLNLVDWLALLCLLEALEASLDELPVGEDQLRRERLKVPDRVWRAKNVRNRGIGKCSNDVDHGVDVAQVVDEALDVHAPDGIAS